MLTLQKTPTHGADDAAEVRDDVADFFDAPDNTANGAGAVDYPKEFLDYVSDATDDDTEYYPPRVMYGLTRTIFLPR